MDWLTNPEIWIALATLTALEVVLGIDNVVFISILAGKLPAAQRDRARKIGLMLAMLMRIAASVAGVDHPADQSPLYRVWPGDLGTRPGAAGGRAVPHCQKHLRDS